MLTALHLEGWMRIPYAHVDLTGAAVHAFWGDNEAGKSVLAEAIRFLYRGMNERVLKKGDYDLLVTNGKRSGFVEAVANDTPIRRNIRDGKFTSRVDLNFKEDHIDLQLDGIEFGKASHEMLRSLFLELFEAKADEKMVRERLELAGVKPDMIKQAMPLIKSVGFESAAKKAGQHATEERGKWKGITGETYGHVKAQNWEPEWLSTTQMPTDEDIQRWTNEVARLEQSKQEYSDALAAARRTIELRAKMSDGVTVENAEQSLTIAQEELRDIDQRIADNETTFKDAIQKDENTLRNAEKALIEAKNAAATLACPHCQTALNLVTKEGVPMLERAAEGRINDADVRKAADAVNSAKLVLATRQKSREAAMKVLNEARGRAGDAVNHARQMIDNARKLALLPEVKPDHIERLNEELALMAEPLHREKNTLDQLQATKRQILEARKNIERAKETHTTAQQWAIIESLCGAGSDGIPAELIGRITKPLNESVKTIAELWGIQAALLTDDMRVVRSDGMPYFLLSKSARWRVNVLMKLALAMLTPLKLVVIDEFDLLAPKYRGAYFGMLADYSQTMAPEVTIITCGTLKDQPPEFDGVRFHHIHEGAIDAQPA
jgi:hypothetical protein